MRYLLLFACLVALCGCSSVSGYEPDETTIKALVSSQIAFHEPQPAERKPDVQTKCTECKGTKQVRSGDGLAMVPCSCGDNCQCQRSGAVQAEPPINNRMLMFTATWCRPCQTWKQKCVADLEKQGWVIAPYREAHIQTINTDDHGEMMEDYNISSWPTFIMVDPSGKEVARHVGNDMTAYQTGEFFYNNQSMPRSSYPKAAEMPQSEQTVTQEQQTYYYEMYQPVRRGRRFSSGCSSGRCR